jgi:hypothetical protein
VYFVHSYSDKKVVEIVFVRFRCAASVAMLRYLLGSIILIFLGFFLKKNL